MDKKTATMDKKTYCRRRNMAKRILVATVRERMFRPRGDTPPDRPRCGGDGIGGEDGKAAVGPREKEAGRNVTQIGKGSKNRSARRAGAACIARYPVRKRGDNGNRLLGGLRYGARPKILDTKGKRGRTLPAGLVPAAPTKKVPEERRLAVVTSGVIHRAETQDDRGGRKNQPARVRSRNS